MNLGFEASLDNRHRSPVSKAKDRQTDRKGEREGKRKNKGQSGSIHMKFHLSEVEEAGNQEFKASLG